MAALCPWGYFSVCVCVFAQTHSSPCTQVWGLQREPGRSPGSTAVEASPAPSPSLRILYPLSHAPTSSTSCQGGGRRWKKFHVKINTVNVIESINKCTLDHLPKWLISATHWMSWWYRDAALGTFTAADISNPNSNEKEMCLPNKHHIYFTRTWNWMFFHLWLWSRVVLLLEMCTQ